MEKLLIENDLKQLYINIQEQNDWKKNIREVIDEVLKDWLNKECQQEGTISTMQELNYRELMMMKGQSLSK